MSAKRSTSEPVIQFESVSQLFRIVHDRPDTLRETFVRLFRGGDNVQDFYALKEVSLTVQRGETVGIIGRNGSGKTTLLKVIGGIYKPTSGRVAANGRVSALIDLGAGFSAELTGRENVLMSGVLHGFSLSEMKKRYPHIVAFAELEEFIDVPIKQYSSGMLARLGFAVATECDPEILLVDEILAVGDAPFQQKSLERMRSFRRAGCTIVLVSHTLGLVEEFCTRVLLLDHGVVVADGPPAEVIAKYRHSYEQLIDQVAS